MSRRSRSPALRISGRRKLAAAFALATVAIVAIVATLAGGWAWAQEAKLSEELGEKREQVRQLTRERTQAEEQLARIQASEEELRSEIEKLAELVRVSVRRKDTLERQTRRQSALVAEQERELVRLEEEIQAGKRRIGQRLRRLYRMAKQDRQTLLFQMARFQTFAKDSHYLLLLQESDRAAIARFESLNVELADAKRQNEQSVQRLLALRGELDEEVHQLSDREAYLRRAIGDVSKNRALFRQYLEDVERMMASMESAIARLERESKEAQPVPTPRSVVELRGTLPAPVEGEIIAAFGAQDPRYELKKRQRGIVLRVAPSAPVTAVAGGRAVHAGPFRGYQSLVVLDHGQGLFSVYGHLEGLEIKRGDWVPAGQLLGHTTYQPIGESYDVYFEIRHNGQPDDPLAWLRPGVLRLAESSN